MITIDNNGKPTRYTKGEKLNLGEELECKVGVKLPDRDWINHPWHYNTGGYECIDVMEECFGTEAVKDFCVCNAFKYLWRCKEKHETPIEDIKKAVWYLDKYLELCKYESV